MWEAIVAQDEVLVEASAERLQSGDFWAAMEPQMRAAILARLDEAGLELDEPVRLVTAFTSRFLAVFRRVFIVGTARRIQDQSALAEAGGIEALTGASGFHHPRLDAQPGPSSAGQQAAASSDQAGRFAAPLRTDIQRRELERRLGLHQSDQQ